MKIALCGSMQFAQKMLDAGRELQVQGHIVVFPQNIENYAAGTMKVENKREKITDDVIRKYYKEIEQSDAVLIVNETKNNIESYIGGNGLIEMAFAYILKKKIYLLNSIPKINYSDEIEAMKPCVLNGDVFQIK